MDLHDALTGTDHLPWQQLREGFEFKVLHGATDDDTRALLLRLQPGTVIDRHRHHGEVHALNLRGWRELDDGRRIGPGGYVYEPPGNVDSWRAVGDEPVVIFVTVRGAIEALDAAGQVTARTTTGTMAATYAAHSTPTAP